MSGKSRSILKDYDPRFSEREEFEYHTLPGRRGQMNNIPVDENGKDSRGVKSSWRERNLVKAPEGHLWLRVRFWKLGKRIVRWTQVPIPITKDPIRLKDFATKFRESIKHREGL